jgi:serine/threonine protein kinase
MHHSGTPEYIPPEVLLNRGYLVTQNSTDVWAFGVILLEILSGIPVWMNFRC